MYFATSVNSPLPPVQPKKDPMDPHRRGGFWNRLENAAKRITLLGALMALVVCSTCGVAIAGVWLQSKGLSIACLGISMILLLRLFSALMASREEENLRNMYVKTRDQNFYDLLKQKRDGRTIKVFTESVVELLKAIFSRNKPS